MEKFAHHSHGPCERSRPLEEKLKFGKLKAEMPASWKERSDLESGLVVERSTTPKRLFKQSARSAEVERSVQFGLFP